MSDVTNILLITGVQDNGIDKVLRWLKANKWPELKEISGYAGGNKELECELWAAAINGFVDLEDFIKTVKQTTWEYRESVQLLVQKDQEDRFTLCAGGLTIAGESAWG